MPGTGSTQKLSAVLVVCGFCPLSSCRRLVWQHSGPLPAPVRREWRGVDAPVCRGRDLQAALGGARGCVHLRRPHAVPACLGHDVLPNDDAVGFPVRGGSQGEAVMPFADYTLQLQLYSGHAVSAQLKRHCTVRTHGEALRGGRVWARRGALQNTVEAQRNSSGIPARESRGRARRRRRRSLSMLRPDAVPVRRRLARRRVLHRRRRRTMPCRHKDVRLRLPNAGAVPAQAFPLMLR